ncbi:helix-turn-helix transcriptional regulator [Lacticaseibacillus sp. GG6-2]
MDYYQTYELNIAKNSIWSFETPTYDTIQNLNYIQEFGFFEAHTGYYTKRNHLRSFLLLITTGGHGTLYYDNQQYPLAAGSIFFIDCTHFHHYWAEGNWTLFFLHANGHALPYFFQRFYEDHNAVVDDQALSMKLRDSMNTLIRAHHDGNTNEFVISTTISEMMTNLLLTKMRVKSKKTPDILLQIRDYLDEHYTEKLTLAIITQHFNISKSYLSKSFKYYFDTTPIEYVNDVRIARAKFLLRNTDLSNEEIAAQIGLHDSAYFVNLFRKRIGTTPGRFRTQWYGMSPTT